MGRKRQKRKKCSEIGPRGEKGRGKKGRDKARYIMPMKRKKRKKNLKKSGGKRKKRVSNRSEKKKKKRRKTAMVILIRTVKTWVRKKSEKNKAGKQNGFASCGISEGKGKKERGKVAPSSFSPCSKEWDRQTFGREKKRGKSDLGSYHRKKKDRSALPLTSVGLQVRGVCIRKGERRDGAQRGKGRGKRKKKEWSRSAATFPSNPGKVDEGGEGDENGREREYGSIQTPCRIYHLHVGEEKKEGGVCRSHRNISSRPQKKGERIRFTSGKGGGKGGGKRSLSHLHQVQQKEKKDRFLY